MADCPTCFPISCPDTDDQNLYSIESPIYPWVLNCPPGFDCNEPSEFHMFCCGKLLQTFFPPDATIDDKMVLINDIVNECATRQLFCGDIPNVPGNPNTPIQLYYNVPKSCTVLCPDGNPYIFFVPAGAFVDTTQALADQRAAEYACTQANLRKICLGSIPTCICKDEAYDALIPHTGGIAPFRFFVQTGIIPWGLILNEFTGELSGTPSLEGIYNFSIRILAADNSYMIKPYTMTVLTIMTTSIDNFSIGVPFTFQMQASGGSGNYQWFISSGVLPDGLTMDESGLITGTPTATGTNPVVIKVLDLSCEAAQNIAFPPRITFTTRSTTSIATVLGYPEYIPSVPPKRYRKITWSGTAEQTANAVGQGELLADAKYVYGGSGEIGLNGHQISNYTKDLYVPCPTSNISPSVVSDPNFGLRVLPGYCWSGDPNTCLVCEVPPDFKGDFSQNLIFDIPQNFLGAGNGFYVTTATTLDNVGVQSAVVLIQSGGGPGSATNVPVFFLSGFLGCWIIVSANHDFHAVLSEEYTDADAIANAKVVISNGATAENLPRTIGFVSRFTNVSYVLNMSNLIDGKDYLVTVFFKDKNFNSSQKQYGFTASGTTHIINDIITTPVAGNTTTMLKTTIAIIP